MPDCKKEQYEKDAATRTHQGWDWHDFYYELPHSRDIDCNCSNYTVYKLTGIHPSPDLVMSPGPIESITSWLMDQGYAASDPVPCDGQAPGHCGCGQQTNCAVVYRNTGDKAIMHVAAFDAKLCDWGGKLTSRRSGPAGGQATPGIVRYCDPGDYCCFGDEDSASQVEMIFYCKAEAAPYISDEAINRGLRLQDRPAEPVPDDFGLFPILRKWLDAVLPSWLRWLALGVVAGLVARDLFPG